MLGGYVTVTLTMGLDCNIPPLQILGVDLSRLAPVHDTALALSDDACPPSFRRHWPVVFERVLYRRLYRATDLDQCLLTIGIVFMSVAAAAYIYGTIQQPVNLPAYLRGTVAVMGQSLGVYRLFLIGMSLVVTLVLVLAPEHTRFGAQVRAAVDNQRMARGLGINVDWIFAVTFALGSGLAGLGGALAIEIIGLDHAFAFTYLVYVLIVVSVGGLGSIAGLLHRRHAARHQRHGRQILFSRAWCLPHLSGHGHAADVAAGRPVREALADDRVLSGGRRAAALPRNADRWHSLEIALARRPAAIRGDPQLSAAGEPDRDYRAVRAVARSHPRVRGDRVCSAMRPISASAPIPRA